MIRRLLIAVLFLNNVVFLFAQNPQLTLNTCTGSPSQLFFYDNFNSTIVVASTQLCIDILAWGTTVGSPAYTAPCHHDDKDPAHQNQEFSTPSLVSPGLPLLETMSGLFLTVSDPIQLGATISLGNGGTPFYLNVTSPLNGGTGILKHASSGLCVDSALPLAMAGPPAVLRACSNARQAFQLLDLRGALSASGGTIQVVTPDLQSNATMCLSVFTGGTASTPLLESIPCVIGLSSQNFTIDISNGHIFNGGAALDTLLIGVGTAYEGLSTLLTTTTQSKNTWTIQGSPTSATLIHTSSSLCLDFGNAPWGHACLDPIQRALPYCDPTLSVTQRVADLLSRLTTDEKVSLTGSGLWSTGESSCDTIDPGVPRLSIPRKQWLVETNSMAASQCYGSICATNFPAALNLAASSNRTLWKEKGRVLSDEMRALNNLAWHRGDGAVTASGLNGFGPDINAMRDPRNGRIGELVADDPFLTGSYAVEFLKGMQEGEDPRYYKMTAGVKHYAGYSMETNRFTSTGNFSMFDLWDTYLIPYEMSFTKGNASGSMCSCELYIADDIED